VARHKFEAAHLMQTATAIEIRCQHLSTPPGSGLSGFADINLNKGGVLRDASARLLCSQLKIFQNVPHTDNSRARRSWREALFVASTLCL
jgi:hypothetical protein